MCLFHFSTCFEQPSAHHQENQLYQYIIWYISLCVGGRLVCRSEKNSLTCIPDGHLYRVIDIYRMMYWYNWFSWWWALGCSKHVEKWNKHIKKHVKLVINTNNSRCCRYGKLNPCLSTENIKVIRLSRLSQRCVWGFRSCGIERHVTSHKNGNITIKVTIISAPDHGGYRLRFYNAQA